jgi:hypothetical protein
MPAPQPAELVTDDRPTDRPPPMFGAEWCEADNEVSGIRPALDTMTDLPEDEAAAVWVDPAELRSWKHNPRNNEMAVEQVARSIEAFGFGAPILARRANGEIIAGHTRLKAAIKMGLPKVPVRYLDVSEDDAHLLAIADNKLGEIADWDDPLLAAGLDPKLTNP